MKLGLNLTPSKAIYVPRTTGGGGTDPDGCPSDPTTCSFPIVLTFSGFTGDCATGMNGMEITYTSFSAGAMQGTITAGLFAGLFPTFMDCGGLGWEVDINGNKSLPNSFIPHNPITGCPELGAHAHGSYFCTSMLGTVTVT